MSKRLRDEAVFDAILAHAFCDAAEADFKDEKKNGEVPVKLTAAHLKAERKAYERYERDNRHGSGGKRFTGIHKAAACILLVCTVGFVTMLAIPPVRAAIVGAVVEFFTEYMSLDFGDSDGNVITVGDHKFRYIPNGFEMVDSVETKIASKYVFENDNTNQFFTIRFTTENTSDAKYDIEHNEYREVSINGYTAYLMDFDVDSTIKIMYSTDACMVTVSGTLSEEEIIKIAKNIS